MQHEQAFPLSLIEQVASSLTWKGNPMWAAGFPASIQCNTWPCSAKLKPKNCQKATGCGDGNQIPHKSTNCLRRNPAPDLWLLKCQRYLHQCAGGEEGLGSANSILCCNFDLTLQVALGSSMPPCFLPHVMLYFPFSCSLSMYSDKILSNSWLDAGQFLMHLCNAKFNMQQVSVGAP